MFFGSPEHLTFLRYEVLSPQRRYVLSFQGRNNLWTSCQWIHINYVWVYNVSFICHFFVSNFLSESGVGAGIDSYYEYLLKGYILLGDDSYLDRFNTVSSTFPPSLVIALYKSDCFRQGNILKGTQTLISSYFNHKTGIIGIYQWKFY